MSVVIIKPKYGRHKLVSIVGYVVFTESVVKVRGITRKHRPTDIYCILHNVSAYLPSYKEEKYAVCVSTFEEVDRFSRILL